MKEKIAELKSRYIRVCSEVEEHDCWEEAVEDSIIG